MKNGNYTATFQSDGTIEIKNCQNNQVFIIGWNNTQGPSGAIDFTSNFDQSRYWVYQSDGNFVLSNNAKQLWSLDFASNVDYVQNFGEPNRTFQGSVAPYPNGNSMLGLSNDGRLFIGTSDDVTSADWTSSPFQGSSPDSGGAQSTTTSVPSGYSVYQPGVDCGTGDISGQSSNDSNLDDCASKCDALPNCTGFSFSIDNSCIPKTFDPFPPNPTTCESSSDWTFYKKN